MDCRTGADPAVQEQLVCDAAVEPTRALIEGGSSPPDAESWRDELAARVERYRSRRKPRSPRYPSLRLPFDSADGWCRPLPESHPAGSALTVPVRESAPRIQEPLVVAEVHGTEATHATRVTDLDSSAKIIEFPRFAAIPVARIPELAEPVMDRPRIVEAPEVLPPPPALGGILIDSAAPTEESRAGADFPQCSASIPQRLLAGLVDSLILGSALGGFAAVFLRLNPPHVPLPVLLPGFLVVTVLWWAAYEFLFMVYTGSTPGLRVMRLRLVSFDGTPVSRRGRRWRVLASFLSACSFGLGYLWSILDEDGLCWHDRITRTHIQSPRRGD